MTRDLPMAATQWRSGGQLGIASPDAENKQGHRKFASYNLPEWVRHPLKQQAEKAAILFPGEGNLSVGTLKDARKRYQSVQEMVDSASNVFGFDVQALLDNGPADQVTKTGKSQPLTYVADCAAYEVMKASYPNVADKPQGMAGFGIGEYAALYVAGVISFEQGLALVKVRAESMEAFAKKTDTDSISLTGYDYSKVEGLCTKAKKRDESSDPQVSIARVCGPDTFVCAGRKATVLKLEELAKKENLKEVRLLNTPAGHTALAAEAASAVSSALDKMLPAMNPPRCELYLNATGWRVPAGQDPAKFISAVKEQLTSPLMWEGSIDQMQRWGIASFYECGPGRSLKTYMQNCEFMEEAPFEVKKPGQNVINVSV